MKTPDSSSARARWRELIDRHLLGDLSTAESHELEAALAAHREARKDFRLRCSVDAALRKEAAALVEHTAPEAVAPSQQAKFAPGRFPWLSWRPLAAAAAGLVIGLFCTSVVLGFMAPQAESIPLLNDGFEMPSSSVVGRVLLEPGIWRGDHAEIVREENGVRPANNSKMLRFLRAGYEGKPKVAGNHLADVYRLIDVRPFQRQFADGSAVVKVSASFNATPFPEHERFGCAVSVYALDAESVPKSPSYVGTALESDANAMARSRLTKLDRDPASWQHLSTEIRLPADTEYVVVRLHITQSFDSAGGATFTGSYADDVHVTLVSLPPLP